MPYGHGSDNTRSLPEGEGGYDLDTETIATIEWRLLQSSVFWIGSRVVNADSFIPSHGFFSKKRTFVGPDMVPYVWKIDTGIPTLRVEGSLRLHRNDGSDAYITSYKCSSGGLLPGRRSPGYLEIYPMGMHMIDMIIVTFVYMEKQRVDMEARAHRGAASGGGP